MRHIISAIILGGAVFIAGPARAGDDIDPEVVRQLVAKGELMPLDEILRLNEKALAGRVIEIELERKAVGYVYEIKVLRDGRKFELKINGRTGVVIGGRR